MNDEKTLEFTFEQLAPAVLGPFRFEGIQSSIDNENTYTLEIEVLEPPRPEPVPPVVTEPIIVSGKYEEVLNPYANTDPIAYTLYLNNAWDVAVDAAGNIAYTLYLNNAWDVAVDAAGNIATTSGDYAVAQNAANACRLFYEDAPLDMTRGIPYFDITLGKKSSVSASVLRSRIKDIVSEIYGVTDVEVAIDYDNEGRIDGGEVQITTLNSKNVTIQI